MPVANQFTYIYLYTLAERLTVRKARLYLDWILTRNRLVIAVIKLEMSLFIVRVETILMVLIEMRMKRLLSYEKTSSEYIAIILRSSHCEV